MLGGIDKDNLTQTIVDKLINYKPADQILIVLSKNAEHISKLKSQYKGEDNVKLFISPEAPNNIANLMFKCDLAIGASGTTSWERCAMGLPSVAALEADNQRDIAKNLENSGASLCITKQDISAELINKLEVFRNDLSIYQNAVNASLKVCDNLGTERVSKALENINNIQIRTAEPDDIDLYYQWANDESVRKNSLNKDSIPYKDHQKWFEQKINSTNSILYIGQHKNINIGQVRFEQESKHHFSVHISVAPEFQGKGYGYYLLGKAIRSLQSLQPDKFTIAAIIIDTNHASKHCFEMNKFTFSKHVLLNNLSCSEYLWGSNSE
jgi:RimJ/RimL family protein N-acetyltransferase